MKVSLLYSMKYPFKRNSKQQTNKLPTLFTSMFQFIILICSFFLRVTHSIILLEFCVITFLIELMFDRQRELGVQPLQPKLKMEKENDKQENSPGRRERERWILWWYQKTEWGWNLNVETLLAFPILRTIGASLAHSHICK